MKTIKTDRDSNRQNDNRECVTRCVAVCSVRLEKFRFIFFPFVSVEFLSEIAFECDEEENLRCFVCECQYAPGSLSHYFYVQYICCTITLFKRQYNTQPTKLHEWNRRKIFFVICIKWNTKQIPILWPPLRSKHSLYETAISIYIFYYFFFFLYFFWFWF